MSKYTTNYYLIDQLTAASAKNGVPAKYVKHGEYALTRYECARITCEIFHLIGHPCELEDVPANDKYNAEIGAVLHYGIMSAEEDGDFEGDDLMTEADARAVAKAAGAWQKKLRASYKPFKAEVLQFNPKMYDKEGNIARLYREFEKALEGGAKLVVGPEAITSAYYYWDREDLAPYTEPVPGPSTELFAGLAAKYHAYLSYGIAERDEDTGDFYNSAVLVGPEGYIGKYRKIHQWEVEKHWGVDGDLGVPVFATEIGNLAMIICIDAFYYTTARLAAVQGADVLIYNTCDKGESVWAIPARALQNGMYVLSANRSGEEKGNNILGCSAIYDPKAHILDEAELTIPGQLETIECQHISAEVDPARYDNEEKHRLFERMPEAYKEIRLNISPWDSRKSRTGHDVNALSVQFTPKAGKVRYNKAKIAELAEEAWQRNRLVNLIILPEMSLTGPVADAEQAAAAAEKIGGPSTRFFAKLAKQYRAAVVFTMVEKDGEQLYHTAVVLEEDGTVAGVYRKIHLNATEKTWAVSGKKVDTFMTRRCGRIGVLIGDEYLFPELADVVLVKRPDIVALPIAYAAGGGRIEANPRMVVRRYPDNAVLLFDAAAQYMQAYLVVANYTGTDAGYAGGSGMYVTDPVYGRDEVQLCGTEETGFVSHCRTLSNQDYWMNQDVRILTRKPQFYAPLTV